MKKLVLLILLVQLSIAAQNGEKNFIDQPYIEVTGKVETEIIPDEIFIDITINEKDKRGKLSVEEQEARLIKQLKLAGINIDKNLTIENFNSNFKYFFLKKDATYKTKKYTLLVHTTKALSTVFKIADRLEISSVFISKVDHSEIEKFRRDAKIKALKITKEKAKNYAEAIDQAVGKALFIKELSTYNNYSNYLNTNAVSRGYNAKILANEATNTDNLTFRKLIITASIEAKFELK